MAAPALKDGIVGVVHVHSDYSHDGLDSLEQLREFALARGIGFVGMTDHAEDFDQDEFAEYVRHCHAVSDSAVQLIPGLEFRFAGHAGLHLLALGLERWIEPRTPDAFIGLARGAARFTILAHPILCGYRVPDDVLGGIDAIEIWNAAYNTRYLPDPRAVRLLRTARRTRPSLVGTAGLDQHDRRNDRRTRVVLAGRPAGDPLAELKAGRFVNLGATMALDPRAEWGEVRLAALTALRWAFDRVERLQERLARLAGGARR